MFKIDINSNEVNKDVEKNSLSFRDISSLEQMSNNELSSFWDEEFHFVQRYNEFQDEYNNLLKESFGWDEEDFDFSIIPTEEMEELATKFSQEKWDVLNKEQKFDSINSIKDLMSDILGIDKVPDVSYFFSDGWGPYGYYDPNDNIINLNIESSFLNNPKEFLNTLIHELRHAYQYERAEKIETREDMIYRCNLENYVSADKSYYAYQGQYVEAEARAYADAFIKACEEGMS